MADRPAIPDEAGTPYEADVHAWALEQAALLRAKSWGRLDAAQIADEIEGVAFIERYRLAQSVQALQRHLLKWDAQPRARARGWTVAIWNARLDAEASLRGSPSLRQVLGEVLAQAYARARIEAADDLGLREDVFPERCPFTFEDILTRPVAWSATAEDS